MAAGTAITPNKGPGVFFSGSFTLDPGSIAAGANEDQTVAVPEAKVGDLVQVAPRAALTDGLIVTSPHVSAAGTVTFTIENHTGGALDQGSGTWDYVLIRGNSGIATAG